MQIITGKIPSALKVVIYGPEGIGKSTFASKFPSPVFCDTEGSTKHMDVRRTPKLLSWMAIMEQVKYFIGHPDQRGTFVLDTADWAERLCSEAVCAKAQKASIEDFGYGKGYTYLAEEFGRLLDQLEELVGRGVHVVITGHAKMRKFEQPDEMGAYDRWEMKLSKTVAPMVKEWADMVLFANYKTYVINVDGQGAEKGKNKAQGGKRVLYTTHNTSWDGKNRHGLKDELPFEYDQIAHLFGAASKPAEAPVGAAETLPPVTPPAPEKPAMGTPTPPAPATQDDIPQALLDLMAENSVAACEVYEAVEGRGYYPKGTLIKNYAPDFVQGVLIGAWPQVFAMIEKNRDEIPF